MEKIASINPATEELIEEIEVDSKEKVVEAVVNARKAFPQWSSMSIEKRIEWINKLIPLIENKKDEIALTITKEMGKPISMSIGGPSIAINKIKYYAKNIQDHLKEEVVFEDEDEKDVLVYEPLGVIAIITPWNYPIATVFASLIPALLCGNTVILKPSEFTLIVGRKIGELFQKLESFGFPKNVFNLVLGGKETGRQVVQQDVDKIIFTGSVQTGREIMKESSSKIHKLLFELGGKDPAIVCSDADMAYAAKKIVRSACNNTGQVCCAVERVYVEANAYDKFVSKAVEEAKAIKVGNPELAKTEIGPFASKFQMDVCIDHLNDAQSKGAKIEFGGKRIKGKGYFFEPTVITNIDHSMKIMTDETFAPIIPIMKVNSIDEAIRYANDSIYGLTGSVWTKDIEKGNKIARQLQVGVAGINKHGGGGAGSAWGGSKLSGIGRLGSREGTHEFTNIKTLRMNK
ncbi:MAG: aldehyde dehydrogenase family protein [Candidatus Woesearchaeota archaeon]|jgi:acyl-CoA reductase-like NAD-dependent aldehyde dehydrogenase|nr:aldehyde dehydrogenase family protein [Candidatus Woesearchaeota archaeon]MDP7622733.1 aldehyde dehydrogenase family protein [Candidatus Woesearchaeota archaeon]HJN57074.1 aldehyde dehydrogenase family protein [Candidatus Woesearchaeota archaeon]|tara:strand:+ start:9354 stop:10733 length:1380 start_codon:yes stop_codon:yes gene_type:complete